MLYVRLVYILFHERREQGPRCCGDTRGRRWGEEALGLFD